jgi:hypothetical protein
LRRRPVVARPSAATGRSAQTHANLHRPGGSTPLSQPRLASFAPTCSRGLHSVEHHQRSKATHWPPPCPAAVPARPPPPPLPCSSSPRFPQLPEPGAAALPSPLAVAPSPLLRVARCGAECDRDAGASQSRRAARMEMGRRRGRRRRTRALHSTRSGS